MYFGKYLCSHKQCISLHFLEIQRPIDGNFAIVVANCKGVCLLKKKDSFNCFELLPMISHATTRVKISLTLFLQMQIKNHCHFVPRKREMRVKWVNGAGGLIFTGKSKDSFDVIRSVRQRCCEYITKTND